MHFQARVLPERLSIRVNVIVKTHLLYQTHQQLHEEKLWEAEI